MIKFRMLIYKIKQQGWIDYDYFNEAYTDLVEMKRQSLLKDIDRINSRFMKNLRERKEAGLPNKGLPAKTQMKKAVWETYYAYLARDDAYQQKAFKLFLNKKIEEMTENGTDCSKIKAYLEDKRRDSHKEYIDYISTPVNMHLPELWVEFFKSGVEYKNIIPKELPHVAYSIADTDIPRFILEKLYIHEYSEQEFYGRFTEEWDITHYNPYDDDDCNDPAYYANYDYELADKPQAAYLCYLCAVNRYKKIKQRLRVDTNKDSGMEGQKWK